MGWKAVYENGEGEEGEESSQKIPPMEKGQRFPVIKLSVTKGQTKPPAAFTEATLLSAMENPIPFLKENNPKEAAILKETGGLGTVATRADIIEKLFTGFLIEKKGNELAYDSKGAPAVKTGSERFEKTGADLQTGKESFPVWPKGNWTGGCSWEKSGNTQKNW